MKEKDAEKKKSRRKMVSFSLDPEVFDRLHQYAFEQHQSMAAVLTAWVMSAKVRNEVHWGQQRLFDDK